MSKVFNDVAGDISRARVAKREDVVDEGCTVSLSLRESAGEEEDHS